MPRVSTRVPVLTADVLEPRREFARVLQAGRKAPATLTPDVCSLRGGGICRAGFGLHQALRFW